MRGFYQLGTLRGVPVLFHWSVPLLALLVSRFEWAPLMWFSYFFLILIHELGHGAAVVRCGGEVLSLALDGTGGSCSWRGYVNDRQRLLISAGGVLAQCMILVLTFGIVSIVGPDVLPESVRRVFLETNLSLIVFNLLPIPPLDGAQIWTLLPGVMRKVPGVRVLFPVRFRSQRDETGITSSVDPVVIEQEVIGYLDKIREKVRKETALDKTNYKDGR